MIDQLRAEAKEHKNNKKYNKAILVYEKIIDNLQTENLDKWLGWEYAYCLKKENLIDKSIDISKKVYRNNNDFKHIKDLLAWLLYEKYFKILNDSNMDSEKIKQLCKIGDFIVNITTQIKELPYENTIYRIIKLLDKRNINNDRNQYDIIYNWIEKLNVDILSKEPIQIKSESIKNIEKASIFEEIIYIKIKCLFYMKKYKETENTAEYFFDKITRFHNDRDKWTMRLISNCKWYLNDKGKSLMLLKEIEKSFNNWIIKYELAKKEYELGNLKEALYHSVIGILGKEPLDKKKSLIKLQRKILYDLEKHDESQFFDKYLSLIDDKLVNKTEKSRVEQIELVNKIRQVCMGLLDNVEQREDGIVARILPNNKAGFIRYNGQSFFFKISNVFSKNIKENDRVRFKIIDSFDVKKNKKTLEAVEIIIIN